MLDGVDLGVATTVGGLFVLAGFIGLVSASAQLSVRKKHCRY